MKFQITAHDSSIFHEFHSISFDSCFTQQETRVVEGPPFRDKWRRDDTFLKLIRSAEMRSLVVELTGESRFRLLFDTWIENKPVSLQKAAFQGILIGLVVDVEGNVTLFSPLYENNALLYTGRLIVFGEVNSLYIYQPEDTESHAYKQFGYAYGDRLKNEHFPVLTLQ
ncbi:MAG: hypothetical protein A3F09_05730 [Chlamydiae bacterium RIFCSPHIGHO2_12_FULL_49_11]|nr:MAG: hypothetical protein A3F09_05730 [Chlamydiae bacterium RIFCSPHIGHO2_12_FULL_49_11]